jgi:phosphoglycolate phosphatase
VAPIHQGGVASLVRRSSLASMRRVLPARSVIFDFDGTLADTLALGLQAFNASAPEFGLRPVGRDETARLRGLSTRDSFRELGVPLHKLPLLVRRVRQQMAQQIASVQLFPGVRECLLTLRGAGVSLGVLTSNSRQNVDSCLSTNGVLSLFDFVHSSINIFGKQRTLRRVLAVRGLPPPQVVYVGDQDRDIDAGHACGIRVIAAGWGYQSREKLESHRPDWVADSPSEVADFVLAPQQP